MDAKNFPDHLNLLAKEVENYAQNEWPRMAGNKVLRFIDGNFRAQGWQGNTFQPWKPNKRNGTILILKGRLRRSFNQTFAPGEVRTFTNVPYAGVHNRGFNGTVTVPAHTRNKYTASRVGSGRFTKNGNERQKTVHTITGSSQVKTYQRKMIIPKRQFMPEGQNDSPILNNSVKRDVIKAIKTIFK